MSKSAHFRVETTPEEVALIADCRFPVSELQENGRVKLSLKIREIAEKTYGYLTTGTSDEIFPECLLMLEKYFSHLDAREVPHAFGLAAMGKLGEINMAAYGGRFTVGMFAKVMGNYNDRRRVIYGAILTSWEEIQAEEREKAKAETKREQFRTDAIDRFHQAVTDSMAVVPMWKTWQDIPWHWAEFICKETDLVQIEDELKREIMAEAIAATWEEYQNEAAQPVATREDQERVREAKKILSNFEPLKNSRCIQNYARLRVWHFCTAKAPEWVK